MYGSVALNTLTPQLCDSTKYSESSNSVTPILKYIHFVKYYRNHFMYGGIIKEVSSSPFGELKNREENEGNPHK